MIARAVTTILPMRKLVACLTLKEKVDMQVLKFGAVAITMLTVLMPLQLKAAQFDAPYYDLL